MTIVNGYTTKAVLKRRLGSIAMSDTTDDNAIERAIEAVSRDIDQHTGQFFYKTDPEPRVFAARFIDRLRFGDFNTLVAATELATDDDGSGSFTAWDPAEYQLLCKDGTPNQNAGPEKRPYVMLEPIGRRLPVASPGADRRFRVRITGQWGWDAIPTAVVEAANILGTETFKLKDAPFGAAGLADLGIVRVRESPAAQIKLREYTQIPVA